MSWRFNRLSLFLFSAALLLAQPETAILRGTVTDPSGTLLKNIEVTLFEDGKDLSVRKVVTNGSGDFEIAFVRPGSYLIKIDANNFETYEADGIVVEAGQIRRVEAHLKPESKDEKTQVHEAPLALNTQSGTVAGVVNYKERWQDAPFADIHPSLFPLLTQAPGVQGGVPGATNGVVIGGVSDRRQQSWSIDGIAYDTTQQTGNPAFFETVEVAISNPGLESAKPVHFDMISRHGTDGIHGEIYYKRGSSAFNSRGYFDTAKANYKQSEVEGILTGAMIPRWTFFTGGAMYQRTPYSQALYADVPTTQMANLDFSQFLNPATAPNGKVIVIRDPRSANNAPFPNNIIPSNRLSPVASKYLTNYYQIPNLGTANTFTQNYTWTHPYGPDSYIGNWPFGRIDQRLANSNQLYFHWMQNQTASITAGSVGEQLSGTQTERYRGWSVTDMWALTNRLSNQFTVGRTAIVTKQGEAESKFNPVQGESVVTTVGIQGVNPNGYQVAGFPAVAITGLTGLSVPYAGGNTNTVAGDNNITTLSDSLIWSKGRHSFKVGGQYQDYTWTDGSVPQDVFGAFTFTGAFTGLGFADFVLGLPSTSTREAGRPDRKIHQSQYGLYAGDSWRVTSRLTVDFGVRWDYYTTPLYNDGYMSNFDPTTGHVIIANGTQTSVSTFYPKAATVVIGNPVPKANRTNFRPRVAAAYRINDRLVFRGGYGEYTENEGYGIAGRLSSNNPYYLVETYTNTITNGVPALSFPKPFPTTPSSSLLPGQSVTALPTQTSEGVIRQYNGTLETKLSGIGLRFSYIGSRGVNMNYMLDINKPKASTIAFTTARRPNPIFASILETRTDGAWHYDSAVAAAERHLGPVTFNASFTWANNESNYANTVDPYNVTNQWTRDGADRRRYFTAGAETAIPVGKGQKIFSDPGPIVSRLISNWRVIAITTFASGQYYSPLFTGADPANASQGFVTQLPDCVGSSTGGAGTKALWFNPAAFAIPPAGAGRYGTCGMNSLEGYPIHIAHVSLSKTLPINDVFKFIFTAQISNVTNSPHFTIPNNNLSTPGPGMFTAASLPANSTPEHLGPRQIDLKLRIVW
jgi:Carboxypeptidase regulatory-like domain/TonB dependent receptor